MNSYSIYVIAFVATIFSGCKPANRISNESKQTLASYERTTCFGKCPAYQVTVFNNGEVEYIGNNFVDSIGKFSTKLTEKEKQNIITLFEEANFSTLPKVLPDNTPIPTDIPSIIFSFVKDGTTYTVRDYDINREGKLFKIVTYVEKVLETKTLHRHDN